MILVIRWNVDGIGRHIECHADIISGIGVDDRGNSINEINFIFENIPSSDAVEWSGAHYRLADLLVGGTPAELAPIDRITQMAFQDRELLALNLEAADKLQKVIVLGGLLADRNGVKPQFGSGPLREKNLWKLAGVTLNTWVASAEGSNYPAYVAESRKAQPILVANPDEVNHWRIPIPNRLADLVRQNLKTRRNGETANPAAEPGAKSGN